jgi:hypothetical protein
VQCGTHVINLKEHQRRLHKPKAKAFKCPVEGCGYMDATVNKAMFVRHLSTHPGVSQNPTSHVVAAPSGFIMGLQCTQCTYRSESVATLARHRAEHHPTAAETERRILRLQQEILEELAAKLSAAAPSRDTSLDCSTPLSSSPSTPARATSTPQADQTVEMSPHCPTPASVVSWDTVRSPTQLAAPALTAAPPASPSVCDMSERRSPVSTPARTPLEERLERIRRSGSWSGLEATSPTLEETLESLDLDQDDVPDVDVKDIDIDQALDAIEPTLPVELTPEYRAQLPPLPTAL